MTYNKESDEKNENCLANLRESMRTCHSIEDAHHFIILGASGDLASKKVYPALWLLYRQQLLPKTLCFVGYARSDIDVARIRKNVEPHCKLQPDEKEQFDQFMSRHSYVKGSYDKAEDFERLHDKLKTLQGSSTVCHRIFYLALPAAVYGTACELINKYCRPKCSSKSWTRIIIEKPFGRDLASSDQLEAEISRNFSENEIYRIDHYLGKEMVQSLMMLRFANTIFSKVWNRESIACVLITFKEDIGTLGRGGYFDQYGIIRDVMQNHLLQILTVVAMEPPVSLSPDDIRDEKIKVLRLIEPVKDENVLVGQYVGNPNGKNDDQRTAYIDDPSVKNKNSRTPTCACVVLYINSDRWFGVPFILKCGKALNERKTEVRVQFRSCPTGRLFAHAQSTPDRETDPPRDELVVRVQPDEAIYLKVMNKKPGWDFVAEQSELDLTYIERYRDHAMPEAYERLILDVFAGVQTNFVRSDELHEAWKVFTPLLERLEKENIAPQKYVFGERTMPGADELCKRVGFIYGGHYKWPGRRSYIHKLEHQHQH